MLASARLLSGPQPRYGPTDNYLARPLARSPFGFRAQHQKVQQVPSWQLDHVISGVTTSGHPSLWLASRLQRDTKVPVPNLLENSLELTILVLCVVLPLRLKLCPTAIKMRRYRSWSSRWNVGHGDKCKACCINSYVTGLRSCTGLPEACVRSCNEFHRLRQPLRQRWAVVMPL